MKLPPKFRKAWHAVRDTAGKFMEDDPFSKAGAMSYFTLLSVGPLLLIVIATAGLIFGRDATARQLVNEMHSLIGPQGAEAIQTVLKNSTDESSGVISLVLGFVMLLIGATTLFSQLQSALNQIWNVKADPKMSAIWGFIRHRLLSFAMVMALAFLLMVSLIVSAMLAAFHGYLNGRVPGSPILIAVLNGILSIGTITLLNAMIFKFLPDVKIGWKNVWFGALITAVLFTAGKFLIGLYLGKSTFASTYGAAGSVVIFMVWVYYTTLIFFLGAEITQVLAVRAGDWNAPTEHAVRKKR